MSGRPLLLVNAAAPAAGRNGAIHAAFVADTLETLIGFTYCADIEIHTDRDTGAWDWLDIPRRTGGPLIPENRDHVVIFGTNTPSLPRAHVAVLLESDAGVTFGPTEQGGFYAVALCGAGTSPGAGSQPAWPPLPNCCPLEDALSAARRRGLQPALGSPWFAVQTPADFKRLDSYLPPRRTLRVLERLSLIPRRKRSSIR
ncbi:MAG TPA: hypothetical protein VFA04_13750 [Bryobacteraceae bacterium]|nr:hypothetical protein [Bryobacteraceae bacterium]